MIVTDMRPLSIVEGKGFQNVVTVFQPGYILPKRTCFTKMMGKNALEIQQMKDVLSCSSMICLTTDVWTSIATEAFLGLTCHFINDEWELLNFNLTTMPLEEQHSAVNIASWIEAAVGKFDIPFNKILAIVHDNAANVVCALKLLEDRHRISSVRCAGHTLQLIVNHALKNSQIEYLKSQPNCFCSRSQIPETVTQGSWFLTCLSPNGELKPTDMASSVSTHGQANPAPAPPLQRGIVKMVLSGCAVIVRGQPRGGPPPERQINLSNIRAGALARRAAQSLPDTKDIPDEPWAFQAREFLRKKMIGKEVCFTVEIKTAQGREYGMVYLGKDMSGENISESLVAEGLATVRREGIRGNNPEQARLCDLEDQAKAAKKGMWSEGGGSHTVRDLKYSIENPRNFVDSLHQKPVNAIIEHVRDGSVVRALLLPDYYLVTIMLSGVKCPIFKREADGAETPEPFAAEAKFFTESRLLQRDVQIILESCPNQVILGTIMHPNGNITELLLKEGFARCVDWSMAVYTQGAEKLRAAERSAKDRKVRIWKDYVAPTANLDQKDRQFVAKVMQIVNADAIVVKLNSGEDKTIHLSSIRPPRLEGEEKIKDKDKRFRPLYDIPYMFEAREFMRKKLIGKKVNVTVDYIRAATETGTVPAFPERTCATVTIGGINIAEALVSKGLATVIRYRQDDDQRSSHYDELLAAEARAIKNAKGLHSKKEVPIHRVADISGETQKAKQFLPFLQRAGRSEAVVEYVFSGSRLKLYMPKETCLITFLLAGIECPRGSRNIPGGIQVAEPFSDEAMRFTKELVLQREVGSLCGPVALDEESSFRRSRLLVSPGSNRGRNLRQNHVSQGSPSAGAGNGKSVTE
ncbi:hypothetical protein ACEWY4_001326 [Coilia grayii]|uniref:TNase-like domain-containing protein n=1 Tax=Coilia grayii TaxID=363190 RepID=A0ABD1KSQ2_9TELE